MTATSGITSKKVIAERGFLAATGFELKALRKAAPPNGGQSAPPLLPMLTELSIWPQAFLAGPVLGGPMAVMALENLILKGAREIIFVGLAGALNSQGSPLNLEIGDLFTPTYGLSTEGTSAHYPAPLIPDENLLQRILKKAPDICHGPVWSTDAIFRETPELVAAQKQKGARAVEMECCALMAAAGFRQIKFAAILIISDIIISSEHHLGFGHKNFKAGLKKAADLAWKLINEQNT